MRYSILLLTIWSFCSCGSGGPGAPIAPSVPSSSLGSGLWEQDAWSSNGPPLVFSLGGNLNVNGSNVSGIMHVSSRSCFTENIDIPVTGTLSDTVNLNLSFPNGQSASFSNLTHDGGHPGLLGGYYHVTAGDCIPASSGPGGGQFVNVGGPWSGTLISSSSTFAQISMDFGQTGPDEHGYFSATGTATFTGETCFTEAAIDATNTRILGRGSTMTLVSTSPPGGTIVLTGDFSGGGVSFPDFQGTYTESLGTCSQTGTISMGT